jgi:Phosphotransferase System HPr (HPr) Family
LNSEQENYKIKEKRRGIMKEFKYVITDQEGIHARPAGELVKAAKAFECSIKLARDGKSGDCKKIFGIMGLGVKKGNEVTLTFEGADEDAACEAISKFMQDNL